MGWVFLVCGTVGGTFLVFQFVMAMIGVGGDELDFDGGGDIPDDFSGEAFSETGDVIDHGSTLAFQVLSFKSIVAALTFFGLAGIAATQSELEPLLTLAIAIFSGAVAMYVVALLMNSLHKLNHDGTVHIQNAIGRTGAVYIPIPGERSGAGKIQIKVQNRLVEFAAVTAEPTKLSTGARVVVVDVVDSNTLEVELVNEAVASGG